MSAAAASCMAIASALLLAAPVAAADGRPLLVSPLAQEGRVVDLDVALDGARALWLVVDDGGDGFACDWADWIEPRLIRGDGSELRLTDVAWAEAATGWGEARVGRNAGGGELRVGGAPVAYGIGVHAVSVLRYDLPPGIARFVARGGLDNGGTDQHGGATARFLVFTEPPAQRWLTPGGAAAGRAPAESLATMTVADGCAVTLFASEPMLANPTDLDVDARGRVWVVEGVDYRQWNGLRPAGDRIVILEDADGDGVADRSTVFYQGKDIDSALGICVLGDRVIVSRSPGVIVFTDADHDDRPEKKEVLFGGIGGEQHDHGAHAVVFGPDGRLYFNVGNAGERLLRPDGASIVDRAGNVVAADGRPYRQGMVFRCALDGSGLDTVAWNFRNEYEVCVDSFGGLWQSDNDDDGNQAVRINQVMEYGNHGYVDELTGAGWGEHRTGIEAEIPRRHWHQDDPGVVPNLLLTGGGAPTGICVYEGDLLPAVFRGQVLHADAGPNVCRAYPVERAGAGWNARSVDLLKAADSWFRPSDLCVAPDGSVYVADWCDPGVGGHQMGDHDPDTIKGRIYRVAPTGHRPTVPALDLATPAGAATALRSPNQATRFLAWTALAGFGVAAEAALGAAWRDADPRQRARALWLLARLPHGDAAIAAAAADADPDLRIVALRAARQGFDAERLLALVASLVGDPSPAVRRECALALRFADDPRANGLWAGLAAAHDGRDRWYLEALGIGAALHEESRFAAWLAQVADGWDAAAGHDIVWRSRAAAALPLLARIIADPRTSPAERLRCFRAFDFHRGQEEAKAAALVALLADRPADPGAGVEIANRLPADVLRDPATKAAIDSLLDRARGSEAFAQLVERFALRERNPQLVEAAAAHAADSAGAAAARLLLRQGGGELARAALAAGDERAAAVATALGASGEGEAVELLAATVADDRASAAVRVAATRGLALSQPGMRRLIDLARRGLLPADARAAAAVAAMAIPWRELRADAAEAFPPPAGRDAALPPIRDLAQRTGDAGHGRRVFAGICVACHVAGGGGVDFGPGLDAIGAKLGKDALYEAILFPDAGIAHGFQTTELTLRDGRTVIGIVVGDGEAAISLKTPGAVVTPYARGDVVARRDLPNSLMPTGLQAAMSATDLVDLVEYLASLRGN